MNQPTKHLLLQTKDAARRAVDVIYQDYQHFPWSNRSVYMNWCAQTYYYVRHATRLLAYAAARCELQHEELHQSFLKGTREERGHEMLALNDLKHLGGDIDQFPEMSETAAYRQTLYYAIDHQGPASLIGWFLPLEGVAGVKLAPDYKLLKETYSDKATSFLKVHCELDIGHFAEGLEALEELDDQQLRAVLDGITLSVPIYQTMVSAMASFRSYLDELKSA